jgi:thymidylate kinase
MKNKGLIVLTGIDGSGKTTQAQMLVETLRREGLKVSYVWTRWEQMLVKPFTKKWKGNIKKVTGVSDGGAKENKKKKQQLLRNPFLRWLWLFAFFFDYGIQVLVKVRFRLIRKGLVVSDRMFYDSVIDQAVNLGSNRGWLLKSLDEAWMKAIFPMPDMVLYIDCPGEIAFSRKDDAPDLEYLTDRRVLYKQLAEKYNWISIDGTLPIKEIASKIRGEVYERLKK